MSRLKKKFDALKQLGQKQESQTAFIPFITAGDPDRAVSQAILEGLPAAGADIIELGMPFTDPSADGPSIDKAAQRALAAGATMQQTLDMVTEFRKNDTSTPIILMGYFNPVYAYGLEKFCKDAALAGVDGLIIVDLPPEEDAELRLPAKQHGLDMIRLITPTSDDARIKLITSEASGFVYYVAVAGITGAKSSTADMAGEAVQRIKQHSDLPVAVGFGIRTPEQARAMAAVCDATVVGSAIVETLAATLDEHDQPRVNTAKETLAFVKTLSDGIKLP